MTDEVYYSKDGVEVTEAMFKIPDGTNFPVRSLSSVKTENAEAKQLLYIAVALLVVGIAIGVKGTNISIAAPLVIVGLLALLAYRGSRRVTLIITLGGVEREAIGFPLTERNIQEINNIKGSLAQAMRKVQTPG